MEEFPQYAGDRDTLTEENCLTEYLQTLLNLDSIFAMVYQAPLRVFPRVFHKGAICGDLFFIKSFNFKPTYPYPRVHMGKLESGLSKLESVRPIFSYSKGIWPFKGFWGMSLLG